MSMVLRLRMSTTLRTGPLPRMGSTRMLPSSSTRAISEPKTEVAPPAGASDHGYCVCIHGVAIGQLPRVVRTRHAFGWSGPRHCRSHYTHNEGSAPEGERAYLPLL